MKANKLKNCDNILYQYIDPEEFSRIVGRVRRERQDRKDDLLLSQYCYQQMESYFPSPKKDQQTATNGEDVENVAHAEAEDALDDGDASWAIRRALHRHKKDDSSNFDRQSCLCPCSSVKQSNASVISEGYHIDNITANNSVKDSCLGKGEKNRTLGYSNITLVSSRKDGISGNTDGVSYSSEKLKAIRLKIKRILDIILSNVEIFKSPEDETEESQLKQKAIEFCGRFSRNHLYEIGRALNETTKCLNYCLPYNRWKHVSSQSKNILNAHQLLLQAFSMFQRHMSIVWGYGETHNKLEALLQLTLEVNRVSFPAKDKPDSIFMELQDGCNKLLEILSNLFGEDNRSCASKSTLFYQEVTPGLVSKQMALASSAISKELNNVHKQSSKWSGLNLNNATEDRYLMYKQHPIRKGIQNGRLNQKTFNNVSARKTKSTYGLRKSYPETQNQVTRQKQSKSCHQICPSSLSGLFRNDAKKNNTNIDVQKKPIRKKKRSDATRVELIYPRQPLEDVDECSSVSEHIVYSDNNYQDQKFPIKESSKSSTNGDKKTPASSNCEDANEDRKCADGGEENLANARGAVGGKQSKTAPVKSKEKTSESRNESNNVLLLVVKHNEDTGDRADKTSNDAKMPSEDGDGIALNETRQQKNYKLDTENENFMKNLVESVSKNILSSINAHVPNQNNQSDGRAETKDPNAKNVLENVKPKSKIDVIKEKLKKSPPAEVSDALHNYRIDFVKSLLDNPLYAHRTIKRPWEIVARLSDQLIDEAIRNVADEMEMETLLKQIVDVELKDFSSGVNV